MNETECAFLIPKLDLSTKVRLLDTVDIYFISTLTITFVAPKRTPIQALAQKASRIGLVPVLCEEKKRRVSNLTQKARKNYLLFFSSNADDRELPRSQHQGYLLYKIERKKERAQDVDCLKHPEHDDARDIACHPARNRLSFALF